MTWDQVGRRIRQIFSGLGGWPGARMPEADEWERAKQEAWDQNEAQARDQLRDRRARRERDDLGPGS